MPAAAASLDLLTVHVMGTAGMGGNATRHVCDPLGRVRNTAGLYVADASLFPSPVAVNPMETIMGIEQHVRRRRSAGPEGTKLMDNEPAPSAAFPDLAGADTERLHKEMLGGRRPASAQVSAYFFRSK